MTNDADLSCENEALRQENARLRTLIGVLWTSRRVWQAYALYMTKVVAGFLSVERLRMLGISPAAMLEMDRVLAVPASALVEMHRIVRGEEPSK